MKRYFAAGLAAALMLCSLCAPAAAAEAGTQTVSLSFETLEETVRAGNVSIKSYGSSVKSVEETDVEDDYTLQYFSMSAEISQYEKQISELTEAINGLDEDEEALRRTLTAQRSSLQSTVKALRNSYDDLEDDEDDAKERHLSTINSTRRQYQDAADQICMSAENTYLSLKALDYSRSETHRSIDRLDREISLAETRTALGMTSKNDLKSLKSQRESLAADMKTLNVQYDNLCSTLAVQCGYTAGTKIETAELPKVTDEQLEAIDYEADLAQARKNSYAIWSKEDAVRQAADDYENDVTDNLYAQEAAKIELEAEKENVTASFRKLYRALEEQRAVLNAAQADLAQAQKTFDIEQTRYDCGMISRVSYLEAQETLVAAEEAVGSAEIELLSAYNEYEWAKRGVMSGM